MLHVRTSMCDCKVTRLIVTCPQASSAAVLSHACVICCPYKLEFQVFKLDIYFMTCVRAAGGVTTCTCRPNCRPWQHRDLVLFNPIISLCLITLYLFSCDVMRVCSLNVGSLNPVTKH